MEKIKSLEKENQIYLKENNKLKKEIESLKITQNSQSKLLCKYINNKQKTKIKLKRIIK
jgi:hypothetical protein